MGIKETLLWKGEDAVIITLEDYKELIADSEMLRALENAGVDNWEGYEFAQELYNTLEGE